MLGHKWEQAQGTIADVQIVPESRHHARLFRYLVDARLPAGGVIRGTVEESGASRRPVGSAVGIEINAKTGELRLDPSQPTYRMAGQSLGPGDPLAEIHTSAGSMQHLAEDIPAGGQGEETQGLVRAMMSGDPAAKQAARDRIMQIRAQAQERAAEHQQAGGAPGTGAPGPDPFAAFDHPGGFNDPAGFGLAPGHSAAADFHPFSAPAPTFGSFDTGAGQGKPEERIAKLQQLLDKGILTESEFREQRQRIINEI